MNKLDIEFDFAQDVDSYKKRVPVRFRIGKYELLGWKYSDGHLDPWHPLWIHSFSTSGLFALYTSKTRNGSAVELDESGNSLCFRKIGESVIVFSEKNNHFVKVRYADLVSTWIDFAKQVRSNVVSLHPEMSQYPYWQIVDDREMFFKMWKNKPELYTEINEDWFQEN